ncbi:hypothetical protein E4T49_03713 [Aureobasidium sp. EXF-10728]|nr:hypothetical protein E4T49_03713 [Aureobasidium sp. EXF-10728]
MPPSNADSAHFNSPELTSGMTSASSSEKVSESAATGKTSTNQPSIDSDVEASARRGSLSAHQDADPDYYLDVFKRRRIVHNPTLQHLSQQHIARANFGSESVKALFNSGASAFTSGQAQPSRNASMPVSSMASSFAPGVHPNIPGPSGADGPVPHTDARNILPGLAGVAIDSGKRTALDPIGFPGSVPRGINVSGVPFTPQPTGFTIPGLGALIKPLDLDNKKTSVSPPVKTRSLLAEPHSRDDGASSNVFGPPQQSASISPSTQNPSVLSKTLATDRVAKPMSQENASPEASAASKKSQITTPPSGAAKESDYVRPSGSPPVWIQKQTPLTFNKQVRAQNNDHSFETFEGANAILSGMNPDHYSMPYGSQVVAIKCPNLDDILMSHQTGFWATNQNVMTRIMDLHNNREDPSMKTLFLWSMPGRSVTTLLWHLPRLLTSPSKHFCGLSELQAFDPKVKTPFWDKETGKWIKLHGSMMISWKYCKLVPYEEVIPLVEGKIDQGSITQMWNGIYTEGTGREVVKAYVEAPHIENMLAAPTGDFFRRAMEHSKIATVPPMGPKFLSRGGYRGRGTYRSTRRGTIENGKTDSRTQPASVPGSATKQEAKEIVRSTQTNATSPENHHDRGEPELQILPVLKYADGSMTTVPDVHGKTKPVTPHKSRTDTKTSLNKEFNFQSQAQVQTQGPRADQSNSLAQTQSGHTLQSSNMPPVMYTPATVGTSFPSNGQVKCKNGSIFDEGGVDRTSFEMPPPPKPSVSQHGSASHSEYRSTPRTMPNGNRFFENVDTWSYSSVTPPRQLVAPKTPVSQSRSLYELSTSPMETSPYGTPTPHGVRLLSTSSGVRLPSTPSRVGSRGKSTFGFGQVPEKLRTPDSSPLTARIQLAKHADTPRPSSKLGHAEQEEDGNKPHWVSMLVDKE